MIAGDSSVINAMEERVEDILTMYAAGVMSRMEDDYNKSLGWAERAEAAAFQLGIDARKANRHVSFGVPKLDRAYIQGRAQASTCKVYDMTGAEVDVNNLPKTA